MDASLTVIANHAAIARNWGPWGEGVHPVSENDRQMDDVVGKHILLKQPVFAVARPRGRPSYARTVLTSLQLGPTIYFRDT